MCMLLDHDMLDVEGSHRRDRGGMRVTCQGRGFGRGLSSTAIDGSASRSVLMRESAARAAPPSGF